MADDRDRGDRNNGERKRSVDELGVRVETLRECRTVIQSRHLFHRRKASCVKPHDGDATSVRMGAVTVGSGGRAVEAGVRPAWKHTPE